MAKEKMVSLMFSIPIGYRDQLREMAAKRNLKNLHKVTNAAEIARTILCDYLDKIEKEKLRKNK